MKLRELLKVAQEIEATETERDKTILDAEILLDCLDGDVFAVSSMDYNQKNCAVKLKLHKGDKKWIEIGIKHPIKLSAE